MLNLWLGWLGIMFFLAGVAVGAVTGFFVLRTSTQPQKGWLIMSLQLKDTDQVTYTLSAEDAKGNPTALGDVPLWASSDETVLAVAPSADGMTAVVKATGKLGAAQVSVHDPGTGLSGSDDVTVVAGAAASIALKAGTPTAQG